MKLLNAILDVIFPSYCASCHKKGTDLCLGCLSRCSESERDRAKWIFPLYDYRHPTIKKSIWLLKYKNRKGLAKTFAEALYGRIMEELSELSIIENFREPVLVPIPLSRKRYKERGFNQAELICQELVKIDANKNFELKKGVLTRIKDSIHQARIENRKDRLKNIIGAFAVLQIEKVKSRNIILIDDVTTTGGTLTEARKVLKNAGANKVIAFTIAH